MGTNYKGTLDSLYWSPKEIAQLASDLIKENYIVSFPAFPSRENPNLQEG